MPPPPSVQSKAHADGPNVNSVHGVSFDSTHVNRGADRFPPLTPYELAQVCNRLKDLGRTPAEIADGLRIKKRRVDDLLLLMDAPLAVRELVASKQLSVKLAISTFREHGPEAVKILRGKIDSVRETAGPDEPESNSEQDSEVPKE